MTVSDYIIEFLEAKGVTHVFTVSGGGSIFLCDALARAKKMKYVCCHHEQAAAFAGEAYARINGLGVTLVTSGPGATNAITGCAASWLDSVPHLFISGQAFYDQTIRHRAGLNYQGLRQLGVQEVNIIPMVQPVTKWATVLTPHSNVEYELEQSVRIATTPRCGPVWMDIPGDTQNKRI